MARKRMRHQNGGSDTEHDRESELGREIALLARLQQRVPGIVRVDKDIDARADRISRDLPAGEHARGQRLAADPDLVALEILTAGAIAIADDGRGVVQIVGDVRGRLLHFGDGDDAFDLVPVSGRLHLASQANQVEQHTGEDQQANAGGNLCPQQLVSIQHLVSLVLNS